MISTQKANRKFFLKKLNVVDMAKFLYFLNYFFSNPVYFTQTLCAWKGKIVENVITCFFLKSFEINVFTKWKNMKFIF